MRRGEGLIGFQQDNVHKDPIPSFLTHLPSFHSSNLCLFSFPNQIQKLNSTLKHLKVGTIAQYFFSSTNLSRIKQTPV